MSDLEAIVDAHSDVVWRTVYRLVNHYDDARDCYQETFLAAVRLAAGEPGAQLADNASGDRHTTGHRSIAIALPRS